MDMTDIKDFVESAKLAVDLLKSAYALLPSGTPKRQEIEQKVKMAEDILRRSDAKLARELGLKLCDCSWPPQIMLWKEREQAHVCPNPDCGHKHAKARAVIASPRRRS